MSPFQSCRRLAARLTVRCITAALPMLADALCGRTCSVGTIPSTVMLTGLAANGLLMLLSAANSYRGRRVGAGCLS